MHVPMAVRVLLRAMLHTSALRQCLPARDMGTDATLSFWNVPPPAGRQLCPPSPAGYECTASPHPRRIEGNPLQVLPLIFGNERKADADYLDRCRTKRNIVEYEYVGAVTGDNAKELVDFVKMLRKDVLVWLKKNHPELIL